LKAYETLLLSSKAQALALRDAMSIVRAEQTFDEDNQEGSILLMVRGTSSDWIEPTGQSPLPFKVLQGSDAP